MLDRTGEAAGEWNRNGGGWAGDRVGLACNMVNPATTHVGKSYTLTVALLRHSLTDC